MYYFFRGLSLIHTKGLKRFVLVPLSINLVLFSLAFYVLLQQLNGFISAVQQYLPSWLSWLEYLLIPLGVMSLVIGLAFSFTLVANWIAAPFNGLLSEKVEAYLTGQPIGNMDTAAFIKDIPRLLSREWQKLIYAIPRAIIFLILFFILPVGGQILWFLFTSWLLAIQYCDYPFDNHKIPFHTMRNQLRQRWPDSFSFGITVAIGCMIPLFNLFVMPIAICGATAMWVDKFALQNDPAEQLPGQSHYRKLDKYC
ncbi:sulfate transporter CysZ [Rheinheimera salexigens]|uniref:Sulfate transporter CysZ n=1 Tax=Rheinheimera salexigens TaxID=1628148 RepID=A0A1E7Q8R7_9GAMM|nr:sulfate transporter CysZ [Rheinheimera salexigens]OEY70592.1 sulfate transporter CysZ [Rheinheimera salexigens]